MQIPLFPLKTVLFPKGPLPLRIFEARYIDMISDRMQNDAPFGVLLIRDGEETGQSSTYEIGTMAKISDFYQGNDGLLGITAVGTQRFRLLAAERQKDGLNIGQVERLEEEVAVPMPADKTELTSILEGVLDDLGRLYEGLPRHFDDLGWVTHRFLEVLPVDLAIKQQCLEDGDPAARLQLVTDMIERSRAKPG